MDVAYQCEANMKKSNLRGDNMYIIYMGMMCIVWSPNKVSGTKKKVSQAQCRLSFI